MKKSAKSRISVLEKRENRKILLIVTGIYLAWVLLMFLVAYVILLEIQRMVLGS